MSQTNPAPSKDGNPVVPLVPGFSDARGSIQPIPCSAMSPRRENAVTNAALSAAKRRSQNRITARPMPAAGPLIAPMIGFFTSGK